MKIPDGMEGSSRVRMSNALCRRTSNIKVTTFIDVYNVVFIMTDNSDTHSYQC